METGYHSDTITHHHGVGQIPEVKVGARSSGLGRFDDQYPVMVIDDWEAHNIISNAGTELSDSPFARALFGDLGLVWPFKLDEGGDNTAGIVTRLGSTTLRRLLDDEAIVPADSVSVRKHLKSRHIANADYTETEMSGMIEKYVIYTDYSPRKEGSKRYRASNLPEIVIVQYPYQDERIRQRFNTRYYMLPGFAEPAEFYNPNYSRHTLPPGQADHRRTLYWNPAVKLDDNGEATITLYNCSRTTHITVEANGQTADGALLWGKE